MAKKEHCTERSILEILRDQNFCEVNVGNQRHFLQLPGLAIGLTLGILVIGIASAIYFCKAKKYKLHTKPDINNKEGGLENKTFLTV